MSKERQYEGVKTLKCIGRYALCNKTLGKGNFARVELAAHTLISNKVAVKIIDMNNIKDDYVRRNLFREARLLRRLSHPNIIKLFETIKYTTQSHTLYCLVMELAEGGELLTFVKNNNEHKRLEEAKARPFVRQLISALYYLHSKGIVHRDLKMENILLNKKKTEVKIIDFGLSNHHEVGELLSTHCGSPEYAAPELFVAGRQYGAEVDVWSLGVNMYAMLVGKLPFRSSRNHSNPRAKLLQQISAGLGAHQEADAAHLHPSCLNLIKGMLQPDPCKRLKLTAVMQHPWVTNKGTWPLYPYITPKCNDALEKQVIHQMSRLLKVNQSDIKRAIDENRLDWISAIYHLLMRDKEQHLAAKVSNTSLSGEMTESTSGVGTSIADEQESKTIEQITALTLNGRHSSPATPLMSNTNRSTTKPTSAKTPPASKQNSNTSSPVTLRPKTAQVPSRQTKPTSGSQSQPVTPDTSRTPRAVSSMSYKIHKQPSAEENNADTAMFTMPKIGRSARHIASRGSPKTDHVYHEYGPQKDKRRILSAPENANTGYNTIPADRSYKHTNTLIDTQKILSHIYKNSNKNGRTYVINGRTVSDGGAGTTEPSNTNHQHVQRKLSAPCRGNAEKPRYYMSGKRSSDLKIDTSTSEQSAKSNKTPSPKSALTRLVEEKYIDHKQRHAWSFKSDRKKSEDTVSWARSRNRQNRNEKNNPELPNISQKACASQQLHLLRQRLQQAREEYNVK
ncbi:MAP/microtubule affinity-regulating kinase 3-like isoform X3 [Bolinopsis microptera]|uniref:MAP/microtubule affinity-regulating kinase 3-like isoform X3 n=1 Tax=Bolinopsis microptera TaxID=2820187 RepID=UPI003079C4FD